MNKHRNTDELTSLVLGLCKLPRETEWVEFKADNTNPEQIGEYVSALANATALHGKVCGYMIWGIKNGTQEIVGTKFSPFTKKKGNEPLETWLHRLLKPTIDFQFHEVFINSKKLVLLKVFPANNRPIAFSGTRYIRVGSSKRKLSDFPEKERTLWSTFDSVPFEKKIVSERESDDSILLKLDYSSYFTLQNLPVPDRSTVLEISSARPDNKT